MLIFLDIDGVMVPAKSWQRPPLLSDGFPAFSPKSTGVLQRLVSDDTVVVLTTSHKAKYTVEEWKDIFNKRGIMLVKLAVLDDNRLRLNRKDEILNWINLNGLNDDFVIIDDDKSLNDLPSFLKSHLVLTSSTIGLTEEHLSEINNLLSKRAQLS